MPNSFSPPSKQRFYQDNPEMTNEGQFFLLSSLKQANGIYLKKKANLMKYFCPNHIQISANDNPIIRLQNTNGIADIKWGGLIYIYMYTDIYIERENELLILAFSFKFRTIKFSAINVKCDQIATLM